MARKYTRLKYEDRQQIEKYLREHKSIVEVADKIGVHRDTIYKELHRSGQTKETYEAAVAQQTL